MLKDLIEKEDHRHQQMENGIPLRSTGLRNQSELEVTETSQTEM